MVKPKRKDTGIEEYRLFWQDEPPSFMKKATEDFELLQQFLVRSVEFCDEDTRNQFAEEAKSCAQQWKPNAKDQATKVLKMPAIAKLSDDASSSKKVTTAKFVVSSPREKTQAPSKAQKEPAKDNNLLGRIKSAVTGTLKKVPSIPTHYMELTHFKVEVEYWSHQTHFWLEYFSFAFARANEERFVDVQDCLVICANTQV